MHPIAADILSFWFGRADLTAPIEKREVWFKSTPDFDAELIARFSDVHDSAARGELDRFVETAEECLALAIALDQFPRNIFRGTPKAFHTDARAREVAHYALGRRYDDALAAEPRKFFYLPLVHSESLADQEIAVVKYAGLDDGKSLEAAVGHRDAIARFGRFPHRNKVLGRQNTAEEEEYMKVPPTWGMTRAEAEERERLLAARDSD